MDREKWLAIRNTPKKVGHEHYVHVSTNIERAKKEDGTMITRKVEPGKTYHRKK